MAKTVEQALKKKEKTTKNKGKVIAGKLSKKQRSARSAKGWTPARRAALSARNRIPWSEEKKAAHKAAMKAYWEAVKAGQKKRKPLKQTKAAKKKRSEAARKGWTEERRKKQSERMKQRWQEKKRQKDVATAESAYDRIIEAIRKIPEFREFWVHTVKGVVKKTVPTGEFRDDAIAAVEEVIYDMCGGDMNKWDAAEQEYKLRLQTDEAKIDDITETICYDSDYYKVQNRCYELVAVMKIKPVKDLSMEENIAVTEAERNSGLFDDMFEMEEGE